MSLSFWTVIPVIVLAGAAVALQAPINSALGRTLDNTLSAACISFGVGFLILIILTLTTNGPAGFYRLSEIQWWQITGGVLGAFYVWATLWGVPTLGVLTTIAALIFGQMLIALFLDTFGHFGMPVKDISIQRIVAVFLVSAGLVLSRY